MPDDSCRILILDSKPYAQRLIDRFQENCRVDSEVINIKTAQKIEQGLGRGVRGEKDYCVVLLTGDELVTLIKSRKLSKYFSAQTKKQIEIGIEVSKLAVENADTNNGIQVLTEVMKHCLNREEGWKQYYISEMDSIVKSDITENLLQIFDIEMRAEKYYLQGDIDKAIELTQEIIDKYVQNNSSERGWYLQQIARFMYKQSAVNSNKLQIAAHKENRFLLKPEGGMIVKKLELDKNRIENIKQWIDNFDNFDELKIKIEELSNKLSFGEKADRFERAFYEVGLCLGFASERPDKEWSKGPDNLWNIKTGEYILFECKNEVEETRAEIHKTETGQMNNACAWFKNNYGGSYNVKHIMIIPTKTIAAAAGFNEPVEIMSQSNLKKLRKNLVSFYNEFRAYNLNTLTDEMINKALISHKLAINDILNEYSEKPYQKK